ncbi:uncharacterized protein LOC116776137 [Danaus plexippus]|uniref:uncharacterized protein LOC116776137 n=1 Tax=Danaus plexippus TaxID=13037 RepID=UPI002AB0B0B4|nr:uncharacterized protein LOC116776137 [Danaus plexippus]
MFKDDDDKDEGAAFGITRYQCMPSLVALQQMRNRLHLAFLGKKLMKWTALATGREMRRLAQELYDVYEGFGEELRNAFILLARCRYFSPPLNSIVLEDIGQKAGVLVHQATKTVSAVKIVQFDIFETEYPPYPHLGLEKGGQTIYETKKAWLDLLKRLIMMMQLRASFLMVELAHKNANKKMNVLGKVVIPRTNVTMDYINNELEEYAREEFFRLKKVLEIKRKMYGDKDGKKEKPKDPGDLSLCPGCVKDDEDSKEDKIKELQIKTPEEDMSAYGGLMQESQLNELIKQISEVVDTTKDMDKKGLVSASVEDFIKTAEELKAKLAQKSELDEKEDVKNVEDELEKVAKELEDLDENPSIDPQMEDDMEYGKLCDSCKNKCIMKDRGKDKDIQSVLFDDEDSIKSTAPRTATNTTPGSGLSEETVQLKQSSQEEFLDDSDSDLGAFEKEVKEITTITRTRNEDGSVSVQKKIVKIERQFRPVRNQGSQGPSRFDSGNPSRNASNQPSTTSSRKSNPYSGSKTVGSIKVPIPSYKSIFIPNKNIRKAKSETFNHYTPMSDPIERQCLSSGTLLSADLDFNINPMRSNNSVFGENRSNYQNGFYNQSHLTKVNSYQQKNVTYESLSDPDNNKTLSSSDEDLFRDSGNSNSISDATVNPKCNQKLGVSVSFSITSSFSSALSCCSVILHESYKNKKKEQKQTLGNRKKSSTGLTLIQTNVDTFVAGWLSAAPTKPEPNIKSRFYIRRKWNVLGKVVVPRIKLTSAYINSELEEIEREDNFRLKRFKELKIKKKKEVEGPAEKPGPKESITNKNEDSSLTSYKSVRSDKFPVCDQSSVCVCKPASVGGDELVSLKNIDFIDQRDFSLDSVRANKNKNENKTDSILKLFQNESRNSKITTIRELKDFKEEVYDDAGTIPCSCQSKYRKSSITTGEEVCCRRVSESQSELWRQASGAIPCVCKTKAIEFIDQREKGNDGSVNEPLFLEPDTKSACCKSKTPSIEFIDQRDARFESFSNSTNGGSQNDNRTTNYFIYCTISIVKGGRKYMQQAKPSCCHKSQQIEFIDQRETNSETKFVPDSKADCCNKSRQIEFIDQREVNNDMKFVPDAKVDYCKSQHIEFIDQREIDNEMKSVPDSKEIEFIDQREIDIGMMVDPESEVNSYKTQKIDFIDQREIDNEMTFIPDSILNDGKTQKIEFIDQRDHRLNDNIKYIFDSCKSQKIDFIDQRMRNNVTNVIDDLKTSCCKSSSPTIEFVDQRDPGRVVNLNTNSPCCGETDKERGRREQTKHKVDSKTSCCKSISQSIEFVDQREIEKNGNSTNSEMNSKEEMKYKPDSDTSCCKSKSHSREYIDRENKRNEGNLNQNNVCCKEESELNTRDVNLKDKIKFKSNSKTACCKSKSLDFIDERKLLKKDSSDFKNRDTGNYVSLLKNNRDICSSCKSSSSQYAENSSDVTQSLDINTDFSGSVFQNPESNIESCTQSICSHCSLANKNLTSDDALKSLSSDKNCTNICEKQLQDKKGSSKHICKGRKAKSENNDIGFKQTVKEINEMKITCKDGSFKAEKRIKTITNEKNNVPCGKCHSESLVYKKPRNASLQKSIKSLKSINLSKFKIFTSCFVSKGKSKTSCSGVSQCSEVDKNCSGVLNKSNPSTSECSVASVNYSNSDKTTTCYTCTGTQTNDQAKKVQTCSSLSGGRPSKVSSKSSINIRIIAKSGTVTPKEGTNDIEVTPSDFSILKRILIRASKSSACITKSKKSKSSSKGSCSSSLSAKSSSSTKRDLSSCPNDKCTRKKPKKHNCQLENKEPSMKSSKTTMTSKCTCCSGWKTKSSTSIEREPPPCHQEMRKGSQDQTKKFNYFNRKVKSETVQFGPSCCSVRSSVKNVSTESVADSCSKLISRIVKKHSCVSNTKTKSSPATKLDSKLCTCNDKKSADAKECICSKSKSTPQKTCTCSKTKEKDKCSCNVREKNKSKCTCSTPKQCTCKRLPPKRCPSDCDRISNRPTEYLDKLETKYFSKNCCKSATPSDVLSSGSNDSKTNNAATQKSSKHSCDSVCSQDKFVVEVPSQCSFCGMKEASTMTRRSDRYDVRPLRLLSRRKPYFCCQSDTGLLSRAKALKIKITRCRSADDRRRYCY